MCVCVCVSECIVFKRVYICVVSACVCVSFTCFILGKQLVLLA